MFFILGKRVKNDYKIKMKNNLLKLVTTRNAFSREYGTWVIVFLNLLFTPVYLSDFSNEILFFSLSIIFSLAFRFELLDLYSLSFSKEKKAQKLAQAFFYMAIGLVFFIVFLWLTQVYYYLILIPLAFVLLYVNIITRRKKGKKQALLAQLLLTGSIGLIPSLFYYIITQNIDDIFWQVGIINVLYYMNSTIYVRSKTMGTPYDVFAFIFSLFVLVMVLVSVWIGIAEFKILLLFLPTFIKVFDNLILANYKVPLRRIGLYETFHAILFIVLFNALF